MSTEMQQARAVLRNQLFEKYFEVEEGILLSLLCKKMSFISIPWQELKDLCKRNIKSFDPWCVVEKIKIISHNQRSYFILKIRSGKYVIIDLETMQNITDLEFRNNFDEEFFVSNFGEVKEVCEEGLDVFSNFYHVKSYDGNIQELYDFYIQNQSVLSLDNEIYYKLNIGSAWTYIYVDFANAKLRLGFQTPDQFLYEHLYLNLDLKPAMLQDAQEKMGVENMVKIFQKIKDIKIPFTSIPTNLLNIWFNT